MFLTRSQVAESILYKLAYPVVNVDLKLVGDAESPRNHLDEAINQTLDFFFRNNVNESTYMSWIVFEAIPGQSVYKMPYWVEEMIEVYSSFNGLLASPFMLLDINSMESFVSMSVNYSDWNLVGYTAARMNLEEINKAVGVQYYAKLTFNEKGEKELHLYPPPRYDGTSGSKFLISRVYRRAPLGQVFGHPLFVEIAAARLMEIWGFALNIFNGSMPGGGTVNGQFIYEQGVSRREKYEQMLIDQSGTAMISIY